MLLQFIFIFSAIIIMLAILILFIVKAGIQLQYLRISRKKKKGNISDFIQFDYTDTRERALRWEAFLLFPLMYAVVLDDDKEELNQLKRSVKRIHIFIYVLLILLIIMGVYSEKVFV